ncbi:MAG TPA: hypothetical protein DCP55_07485 [Chitinophagaceae bacterium]|nr:hypothetical protein [Pseudomonadota bacterium]HAL95752.1 hypothetical protein [Chitinophagaceae bacterium]
MKKDPLTFEQKKAFLQDLDYAAVQACSLLYIQDFKVKSNDLDEFQLSIIHDSLIESSLLFLRKINEFFGCKRDACRATDFIPEYKSGFLFESKKDKELVDNHVCHITYENVLNGKKDWADFLKLYVPKAKDMFITFCHSLNDTSPEYFKDFIPVFFRK